MLYEVITQHIRDGIRGLEGGRGPDVADVDLDLVVARRRPGGVPGPAAALDVGPGQDERPARCHPGPELVLEEA